MIGIVSIVSTLYSFGVSPAVVQNNETDQASSTAIVSIFTSKVTSGDLLVYQIFENQTNGGSHKLTVFDNVSTPLTKINSINQTDGTHYVYAAMYYGIAASTAAIRVEFNASSATGLGLYIYEISGLVGTIGTVSGTNAGNTCGCTLASSISNSPFTNAVFLGGSVLAFHQGGTWTFTNGYTSVQAVQQTSAAQFLTVTTIQSSIFAMSYSFGNPFANPLWAELGVVFYGQGASTTSNTGVSTILSTVTVYVPPSVLSLHFWWYPFFTLLLFDVLFVGAALGLGVPQEDLIFMALLGLIEASWIAYFMQVLPPLELILFSALFILYEWRANV